MHHATRFTAVLVAAMGGACARDAPTAVEPMEEERPPPARSAPAADFISLKVALDDVLNRILPVIDEKDVAEALRAPLSELAAAFGGPVVARASGPLRAAEDVLEGLARTPAVAEEHDADVEAIRLVLEQAAALVDPAGPAAEPDVQ